ncbi:MAG: hypothetical protein ABR979_01830 [Halobacteriota archaeon]|jgi:uncharacterized protein YjaZ
MKICIELDEKMEEMWETVKRNFEFAFRRTHEVSVTLPDYIVFEGLLEGFENEMVTMFFPAKFTDEQVQIMSKR